MLTKYPPTCSSLHVVAVTIAVVANDVAVVPVVANDVAVVPVVADGIAVVLVVANNVAVADVLFLLLMM